MTLKGFDLGYDPKNGVIRGHDDLLEDPKGHGELCGQFDLVYDPIRGCRDLLYDPMSL